MFVGVAMYKSLLRMVPTGLDNSLMTQHPLCPDSLEFLEGRSPIVDHGLGNKNVNTPSVLPLFHKIDHPFLSLTVHLCMLSISKLFLYKKIIG